MGIHYQKGESEGVRPVGSFCGLQGWEGTGGEMVSGCGGK